MNTHICGIAPSSLDACSNAASFLQSGFWGSFKARFGWKAIPFDLQWAVTKDGASSPLLVLHRRLAPGLSFAYLPWGPELPEGFSENDDERTLALSELSRALRPFLPKNTAFVRFDPPWYSAGEEAPPSIGRPFAHAGADVQPPDTVLIDLDQSEEALFAGMKSKWRYNSRLALKKGVIISRRDETGIDVFYSLLCETARRDGIAIHSVDYYRTLFSHCQDYAGGEGKRTELRLYLAEHEGDALAAILVLLWGSSAVYLYGASSNVKRNFMAPYALQTRAMIDARSAGCTEYDLFGIPPDEDPSHPMAGLYRFKTGFGGRIVHRPGSWDYFYRPLAARIFRAAEFLRKKFRDRKKQRSREPVPGD